MYNLMPEIIQKKYLPELCKILSVYADATCDLAGYCVFFSLSAANMNHSLLQPLSLLPQ